VVKFYRFTDDFYGEEEYDYIITNIHNPFTGHPVNFHYWQGDNQWHLQYIKEKDFFNIIKPKFRNTIEQISKIPTLQSWVKRYIFYYIFGSYKKVRDYNTKYKITWNLSNYSK
jgi:hypothetical protein